MLFRMPNRIPAVVACPPNFAAMGIAPKTASSITNESVCLLVHKLKLYAGITEFEGLDTLDVADEAPSGVLLPSIDDLQEC